MDTDVLHPWRQPELRGPGVQIERPLPIEGKGTVETFDPLAIEDGFFQEFELKVAPDPVLGKVFDGDQHHALLTKAKFVEIRFHASKD
jgi:hypothetical protein